MPLSKAGLSRAGVKIYNHVLASHRCWRQQACGKSPPPRIVKTTLFKNSYSQHLEYLHVAAQDPVCLGTQLDAHGAAGGADHQAVDEVGLTVVAHTGCHLLVGRVVALHFHVDLVGSDNNWFETGFSQGGLLRDQVRTRVEKAEGEVGLSVTLLLAAISNFLQAWRIVPTEILKRNKSFQ